MIIVYGAKLGSCQVEVIAQFEFSSLVDADNRSLPCDD